MEDQMPERASQQDLDDRIALARRNIEDLTEQATATSGSGAEEAIADRISEQQAALDELLRQREAMG
jgi:lysyl-tRNA synthetase class I